MNNSVCPLLDLNIDITSYPILEDLKACKNCAATNLDECVVFRVICAMLPDAIVDPLPPFSHEKFEAILGDLV